MQTTILFFAWFGLVAVVGLSSITLYLWLSWLWEQILNRAGHPKGLYAATKLIIQLRLTKNKDEFVGYYVANNLNEVIKDNPGFERAFRKHFDKKEE